LRKSRMICRRFFAGFFIKNFHFLFEGTSKKRIKSKKFTKSFIF